MHIVGAVALVGASLGFVLAGCDVDRPRPGAVATATRAAVPQVIGPVITLGTLGLATAILAAASLSFLGLGAQPPMAEWSLMLADGRKCLRVAWWLADFPGLAIMLTVMAINMLGDGVHDALDPRIGDGTE